MILWVTRTTVNTLSPFISSFFFETSFAANDCIYWLLHIGYVGWMDARVRRISGASCTLFSFDFQFDSVHHVEDRFLFLS